MAHLLRCKVGNFPFNYLGLPVGASMRLSIDWQPVVHKFKKKLADWKMKCLSFGGRLTLIKAVMGGLAQYFFSLFLAPKMVVHSLERLRRIFFWGGSGEGGNKMSWVGWDRILKSYKMGGLGVGGLREQNLSLMGKWWWRFKTEENSLWVRVIKSIYGYEGGLGQRELSAWARKTTWGGIVKIRGEMEMIGLDWSSMFRKQIGDGGSTYFWKDRWWGELSFMDKFPRMYRLDREKEALVRDKGSFRSGRWVWAEIGTSNPRGRVSEEVVEMSTCLNNVSLNAGTKDKWWWEPEADGIFSVRSLRKLIEAKEAASSSSAISETKWNSLVPKKINIFLWRVLQEKIPVRVALDHRGIDVDSVICPICGEAPESVDHCLVGCKFAGGIWDEIFSWWNWDKFNSSTVADVALHPGHAMFSKSMLKLWQAALWVSLYFIWWSRNDWVFNRKAPNSKYLMDQIQAHTFNWITRRGAKGLIKWDDWICNPVEAARKVKV